MPGPILALTLFTASRFHAARAISLATFPPGFLILLIQGILASEVLPAIGIIPLFCSSAFSALLLANEKKCGCAGSGLVGTPMHLVCDVLLGFGLLFCVILSWLVMGQYGYADGGLVVLGTYGTNFLICNFCIHGYLVLQQLHESFVTGPSYPLSCPQCHHVASSVGNVRLGPGGKQGYAPLVDHEGVLEEGDGRDGAKRGDIV